MSDNTKVLYVAPKSQEVELKTESCVLQQMSSTGYGDVIELNSMMFESNY